MSEGIASERRRAVIEKLPGTPYRLLDRLGGGSAAVVYRAEDTRSGDRVAIKIMRYRRDIAPQLADRMRLEGEALAKLEHRNLVRVLSYGEADEHLYLVMEEAAGRTLDEELKERVDISASQACFIASEILSALAYVHKRGIVHRDIKPSNIMLLDSGGEKNSVKLFDFGILKLLDSRTEKLAPLRHPTEEGQRLGTARYVAPEQASSGKVDARSDLYSVGVLLYEMLSGQHPFAHCTTTAELYKAHITEPPPPLSARDGKPFPKALSTLVMQLLSKKQDERPGDAALLANQLKAAAEQGQRGKARTMIGMQPKEAARAVAAAKRRERAERDTLRDIPSKRRQELEQAAGGEPQDDFAGEESGAGAIPPAKTSDHGAMPDWYAQGVRKVRRESGRGTLGLKQGMSDDWDDDSAPADEQHGSLRIPMQSGASSRTLVMGAVALLLLGGVIYWAVSPSEPSADTAPSASAAPSAPTPTATEQPSAASGSGNTSAAPSQQPPTTDSAEPGPSATASPPAPQTRPSTEPQPSAKPTATSTNAQTSASAGHSDHGF